MNDNTIRTIHAVRREFDREAESFRDEALQVMTQKASERGMKVHPSDVKCLGEVEPPEKMKDIAGINEVIFYAFEVEAVSESA